MSGKGLVSINDFQNVVAMKRMLDNFNHQTYSYKITKQDIELFLINSTYFTATANARS